MKELILNDEELKDTTNQKTDDNHQDVSLLIK